MRRVYLDYAATTPTHPEVLESMKPYFTEIFGNPSSIHACGQASRAGMEDARKTIADFIGARPDEIVFTSGGTEADNFALQGIAYAREKKGNHIITSAIEHHAVLETCRFLQKRGFEVTFLPVDGEGFVNPDDVRKKITPKTIIVSVMHANNEIGTVEPVAEIGKIAREAGVVFHTDAVQTLGHLPLNVDDLNVDLLSASAHKLYGPKGIGILYIRKGLKLVPFMHGGEQERGRRASTENVAGAVGFAKAVEIARKEMDEEASRLTGFRDRMIDGLLSKIEASRLNGPRKDRLPNNVNISVEYIEGESMCLNLDMEGVCASTGSACSSSSLEPSHVILALGLSHEQAHGSLRLTMGKWSSEEDVNTVIEVLPAAVARLRAMSPLAKSHK